MIKTHITREQWSRKRILAFHDPDRHGNKVRYVSKIEWTEEDADKMMGVEIQNLGTLRLEQEEAQHLMDALWDSGIKPSEGTGSAGALLATQKHLEDMRRLVLKDTPPLSK